MRRSPSPTGYGACELRGCADSTIQQLGRGGTFPNCGSVRPKRADLGHFLGICGVELFELGIDVGEAIRTPLSRIDLIEIER